MRQTLSAFLLATTAVSAVSANDEDHYYAGFEAGLSLSAESDLTNSRDNLELEVQKDAGPHLGVYFGKKYGKYRYELEYGFYRNNVDGFDQDLASLHSPLTGEFPGTGKQKTQTFMVNGYREFETSGTWKFLAGAGVGMAHIGMDRVDAGANRIVNDRSWAPAAQIMAQLVHPIGAGLEFGLGLKMMRSTKADFNTRLGRVNYHGKQDTIFARLSWRFGQGESRTSSAPAPVAAPVAAPAPAPTPAPVAAPAPVQPKTAPVVEKPKPLPLPKPYIVYFDFDSADLTSTAARTVADAARGYRNFKAISIEASGHTDSAGSDIYNEKLAERRVETVKAALIREGVPADKIIVSAKGEKQLAVQTEDGVRNDKNRRVEIKLVR